MNMFWAGIGRKIVKIGLQSIIAGLGTAISEIYLSPGNADRSNCFIYASQSDS